MNKNLVNIKNNTVFVSTKILAQELNRQHRAVYNLVNKYKKELEMLGVLSFQSVPKMDEIGGGTSKVYYLNEEQFLFLIMNMRTKSNELNTVMKIKIEISKQFVSMKKWILEQKTQKANQEYIEMRKQSKIGRRLETDIIKQFVEYATKQGSKSANKYYMNISKMENKAFFIIKEKFKNVREILNMTQLSKIMYADIVVRQALIEGMEKELYYKDIYQLAKNKVIQASETLPKEIIPGIKFTQIGRGFLND